MTTDELSKGFRELGLRLYSKEFTELRRKRFKETLRRTVKERRKALIAA
jgi:hypothetical protein